MDKSFSLQIEASLESLKNDPELRSLSDKWLLKALESNYSHNFSWLGLPIIQTPPDIYSMQELIWKVRPDLIIETGVARGGSVLLSASLLALIEMAESIETGHIFDLKAPKRKVIGIDIEIRSSNRQAIEQHPFNRYISLIEGSSTDPVIIEQVKLAAGNHKTILVMLDSNHTHEHVLKELRVYAPLVTSGSYCIVWDTSIDDLPQGYFKNRPWDKGNNPKTAVFEYLKSLMEEEAGTVRFTIDQDIEAKLVITAARSGFLRRV